MSYVLFFCGEEQLLCFVVLEVLIGSYCLLCVCVKVLSCPRVAR